MNKLLMTLAMMAGLATIAHAHFVFVIPDTGGASAKLIMNETLQPSQEVDISIAGGAKLSLRSADGKETGLSLVKGENGYYSIVLSGTGTRVIHGVVDLGVMQRGPSKPNVLMYYPKTILGNPFDSKTAIGSEAAVEIVPISQAGALRLQLLAHGKPEPNAEITVILPDGTQKKITTDAAGQTEVLKESGRYGAWARYWEKTAGERDGKKYEEVRHYATLVFDTPSQTSQSAPRFATLPEATSSFGAVASEGWLYIYGGHISPTHSYSTAAVSGRFSRLNLSDAAKWEELPAGPALQGMNLAAYRGKIYRIGGMSPRNKPGEKTDTWSVADCARYDPVSKRWEELPPLPQPRSSHDVVVIGNKLIVMGGWTLKGAAGEEWRDTLEVLDLSAETLAWTSVQQPFKRRALIAAAYSGKMYVLGGFDENSKVVNEVAIYDPVSGVWTKGPELPGKGTNTFAPAACANEAGLFASVADGTLYRLDETERRWEKSGMATPRVAHRLASSDHKVLVIGGADKGKNSDLIEAVSVTKASHTQSKL